VAGIVDDGDICPDRLGANLVEGIQELAPVEIVVENDVETLFPKGRADSARIACRVVKSGERRVVAVAYDQGNAFLLRRLGGGDPADGEQADGDQTETAHPTSPCHSADS
jgi:hypothetical protein